MANHPNRSRRARKTASESAAEYERKAADKRQRAAEFRAAGQTVRADIADRVAERYARSARGYAVAALAQAGRRIP